MLTTSHIRAAGILILTIAATSESVARHTADRCRVGASCSINR